MASGGNITPDGGGELQFISLKGLVQSLAMVVQDISRPGVDGHAYRQDAKRAQVDPALLKPKDRPYSQFRTKSPQPLFNR